MIDRLHRLPKVKPTDPLPRRRVAKRLLHPTGWSPQVWWMLVTAWVSAGDAGARVQEERIVQIRATMVRESSII
jgi:hypothetical protein